MKYLLTSLCLCFASFSYGQNTNPWPATGNIGIGTMNPGGKALYVKANSDNDHSVVIENISTTGYGVIFNSSNDPFRVGPLGDYNGGYFKIASNGKIGIGITNPNARLDINGGGILVNIAGNNSSFVGADFNLTRSSTLSAVGKGVVMQFNDPGSNSNNIIQHSNEGLQFFNSYNGWGWYERMRISDNGNVGIGTTNPTQRLTVKGTVYSTEVKVDLAAGSGPDYVFEPTYTLPSLDSVQSYINQNKHLPEVPSAKEMEANGVNLGEMNMLLLKKVEELMLYAIEANKKIEAQDKQIQKILKTVKVK